MQSGASLARTRQLLAELRDEAMSHNSQLS
jgi:hypothetical protein